jgi:flagellar biosynthesis GTPase FlhF
MDYTPRERIGKGTEFTMLFVSCFFYLGTLVPIPILNDLINLVAWGIYWFWFKIHGASISKNAGKNVLSLLVSFIPFIGDLFGAFPFIIYLNIRTVQKEDAAYNKAMEEEFRARREAEYQYALAQQASYDDEVALADEQSQEEESEAETEQEEKAEKAKKDQEQEAQEGMGQDALDILNSKPNKTDADIAKLSQAADILRTGKITDYNDSIQRAAWNKHNAGVREYNPTTRQGSFRFSTTNYQGDISQKSSSVEK